ncbi:hypothetical protein GCM10025792_40360 [Pseudonocardia tropica]|jgi:WhiB family redox-sensing transcriptional regulator|uniref:WhiB family transcriptional regulator n=1 Tax=Pseudonocardia tropica TaxID=681289 RepID=UPI0033873437
MKTVPRHVDPQAVPGRLPCADTDVIELFFPVGTAGPALQQIAEAKAICRHCPVLQACRAEALARPGAFTHGVVGGLSEDERNALLRRRAARRAGIR